MLTLQRVLFANAASCLLFGALLSAVPAGVAGFLGAEAAIAPTVIRVLGIVLAANGIHLIWAALQQSPAKALILWFSAGDILWALGTSVLVFIGGSVTSTPGVALTLVVAAMVAAMGIAQLVVHSRQFANT
jgi:hypothetical protein